MRAETYLKTEISPDILIHLFRTMLLIRRFEEKIIEVYPAQDMKSPVHLYIGQEAIAAAVCAHLTPTDYLFTTHRSHGHFLAKGGDPKVLYAEFYGRITGCCKGKGGSMHPADPKLGIFGTSAIVGGGIPLAVGAALKSYLTDDGRVTAVFFGDGASEQGVFHESMNFASLKNLPVIFVCENNFYATNSHLSARQPHDQIFRRAESYGMPGEEADGNDVLDIYAKAERAIKRARKGEGPTLMECKTYRWKGHVGPDCDYEKGCRPKEELENWMEKCPIEVFKSLLVSEGILTEETCREMSKEIHDRLDSAMQYAKNSSFPEPNEIIKDIYFQRM